MPETLLKVTIHLHSGHDIIWENIIDVYTHFDEWHIPYFVSGCYRNIGNNRKEYIYCYDRPSFVRVEVQK